MCTLKKFIARLWDKLIHAHYLHYIGILAICASLLVTVFNYEVSIIRAADTFLDFADSLLYLKEFLAIRDGNDQFNAAREKGSIGIPAIVKEDGSVTLDWDEFLK